MTGRRINILFLFLIIIVFILFGKAGDHYRLGIALILAFTFAMGAFILDWLTLDGAYSATLLGTIAYGLGDWGMTLILLVFFLTASLVSKNSFAANNPSYLLKFRRTSNQVWANGFWFAFWLFLWFLSKNNIYLIAASVGIATVTADTWAAELGATTKGRTYLFLSGKEVEPGTNGGVSVKGTLFALAGSFLIALLFWLTNTNASILWMILITLAGLLGCFVDSYLGSRVEGGDIDLSFLNVKSLNSINIPITNNVVNWMAAGSTSVLLLLIALIIN